MIHGLEGGRIAMLTKVHHSAVDGMSGAEIMGIIMDLSPEGRDVPPPEEESHGERVPVPTGEPDPRKRLMRVHEAMRSAKERHSALPADLLQDANRFVPLALLARSTRVIAQLAGVERFRPPINLTISNVPGPQFPLFCVGAKLEANYPVSVITDGAGLNITVLSYMGHLDFGIVADREQIDDVWPMLDRLCHSLEELDETLCGKPAASRPAEMPVAV